jgi:ABC-type polysaccharide/polyol phosphate transport system ATPase subunit
MAKFTTTTGRKYGKIGKRGAAKSTLQTREFIFQILKENRGKLKYMLDELTPREFCDIYMRLIPFIIAPRTMQRIDIGEVSKDEMTDMVEDIIKGE